MNNRNIYALLKRDIRNQKINVTANGTSVVLNDLQGGVPFSEIILSGDDIVNNEVELRVCGKNLLPLTKDYASGWENDIVTVNIADDGKLTITTDGLVENKKNWNGITRTDKVFVPIRQGEKHRISMQQYGGTNDMTNHYVQIVWRNSAWETKKTEYRNLVNKGVGIYDFGSMELTDELIELGVDRYEFVPWYWTDRQIVDWNISLQAEIGDTATEFEPYHGETITVTPTENQFILDENLEQYEGTNTVIASIGELSVTGVKKNAAIEKMWKEIQSFEERIEALEQGV